MDQKYDQIRKKLDGLKITEHIGRDSLEALDKLLNQYFKMTDLIRNLKKKIQTKTQQNSNTGNSHQLDILNEKYGQLKQQNESLKRQIQEGGISQKIRMLEKKLRECQSKYEIRLDDAQTKLVFAEKQVKALLIENKNLGEQNQKLRNSLENYRKENESTSVELKSLLEKKKKQIQTLSQENGKYRIKIRSIERLYDEERSKSQQKKSQSSLQQNELIQVLKQQIEETDLKFKQIRQDLAEEQQNNKCLRDKNKYLAQQINLLKNEQSFVKKTCDIQSSAKSKIQLMLNEANRQVSELKQRIKALEMQKQELEREIERKDKKVSEMMDKNSKILRNSNNLQEQLEILNENFKSKIKQIRQMENNRVSYERRIKDLEKQIQNYKQRNSSSLNFINGSSQLHQQKTISTLKNQIQLFEKEIGVLHENQNKILTEKSRLQSQVKKYQKIISQGNNECQKLQSQKQNLQKQNKELRNSLQNTQTQGNSSKQQIIRMTQTIQDYELMIRDLQNATTKNENMKNQLSQKISELQKKMENQQQNNKLMHEENRQMTIRIASLEKLKQQLLEKYNRSRETQNSRDSRHVQYMKQHNELVQITNSLRSSVYQKQLALKAISDQKDQLLNQLDNKTIQNQELFHKLNKLEKDLENGNKDLNDRQINMQGMQNTIKTLEYQLQKKQKSLQNIGEQLNQCHKSLMITKGENQQLKNQIKLIVQTNKSLEKEKQNLQFSVRGLQKKLKDRNTEIDQYRQNMGSYKIENQNLIQDLKKQKMEYEKWKKYVEEAAEENQNMYNILTQKDISIRQLEQAIKHLGFQNSQKLNEIASYERQTRQLSQQLLRMKSQVCRLEQDCSIYKNELNLSRRSMPSQDWKLHLQERLESLQSDYVYKQSECQNLRKQCKKLQSIIEIERGNVFKLTEKLESSRPQHNYQAPYSSQSYVYQNGNYNLSKTVSKISSMKTLRNDQNLNVNVQNSQTPIKQFDRLRKSFEHSEIYDYEQSIDDMRINNSMPDNSMQSYATAENCSLSSKQLNQNLQFIEKQYNQTIFNKKK